MCDLHEINTDCWLYKLGKMHRVTILEFSGHLKKKKKKKKKTPGYKTCPLWLLHKTFVLIITCWGIPDTHEVYVDLYVNHVIFIVLTKTDRVDKS
jgi:hypothetical protein